VSARCDITAAHAGLAARVAEIATALVGEPNRRLSSKRQLRFGRKGSLAVTTAGPKTGSWYDHENGVGGDLFSLIRRNRGGGFLDALAYAERIIGRRPTQPESPATAACRDQADDCSAWNRRRAGELWQEAVPITATVASRYLANEALMKDAEGKAQYASILEFPERAVRDAFSAAVVRAVIEHSPAAFDGEQGDARDSRPAPASDIPF
jgi:hypothetical protein